MNSNVALEELLGTVRSLGRLYQRAVLQQYFRGLAKRDIPVPKSLLDIDKDIHNAAAGTLARSHPIRLAVLTLANAYYTKHGQEKGRRINSKLWDTFYGEFDHSPITLTPEYGSVISGAVPDTRLLDFAERNGVCWTDNEGAI